MSRIEKLKKSVNELYLAKKANRTDWADWLFENHIFIVVEQSAEYAERFGANKELVMAASMLHDVADAVMSRNDPRHEEESLNIARSFLKNAGFSDEESRVIVEDAIRFHGCHAGKCPSTLEGKVMATADAVVHLRTDFYECGARVLREEETVEWIKNWALPKLERDFNQKIFFPEVREEVRSEYERLKRFFSEELQ